MVFIVELSSVSRVEFLETYLSSKDKVLSELWMYWMLEHNYDIYVIKLICVKINYYSFDKIY